MLIGAVLAACGGGGGGSIAPIGSSTTTPTQTSTGSPSSTQSVSMSITIPHSSGSTSSNRRSPKYIPSNTGSLTLQLLTVNGVAQTNQPVLGPFNLTSSNTQNCKTNTTTGNLTCTFSIVAPVGTDAYLADTYASTDGSGQSLGSGAISLSVRTNASNSANLVLTGPVAQVALFSTTTQLYNGNPFVEESVTRHGPGTDSTGRRQPQGTTASPSPTLPPAVPTSRIFVLALDVNGNQIINPTTFDIPVNLQLSLNGSPANAVTLTVNYAGLAGEPTSPESTSADGGTVTIYAPADSVTLTVGSGSGANSYDPSVEAIFTPQGGTQQTSAPLTYQLYIPPAAPYYGIGITDPGTPFTALTQGTFTISVQNLGTAPTTGGYEVNGYLYTNGMLTSFAPTSNYWSCTPGQQSYDPPYSDFPFTCTTTSSLTPGSTAPNIYVNVTPDNQYDPQHGVTLEAYPNSGGAANSPNGYDFVPVNSAAPTPTPSPGPTGGISVPVQ